MFRLGLSEEKGERAHHFEELGILHHHRMDDTEEALVRWEDTNPTGQGIALQEALTHVFTENFDYTTTSRVGKLIPLEVAVRAIEDSRKFVTLQLVWREQS